MTALAELILGDDLNWAVGALCAEIDPDLWHPEVGGTPGPAKAICHTCPVEAECLTYALDHPDVLGIWGGTIDEERKHIRTNRRSASNPLRVLQ